MAERIGKLSNVRAELEQYQQELEERVEAVQEGNLKQMLLIKDAAQHLDSVMQVETRCRGVQMASARAAIEKLRAKACEQFDATLVEAKAKFDSERRGFLEQTAALRSHIVEQEDNVAKIIADWRSTSSESTQMLKALVDEMRAKRIADAGLVRQVLLDQTQQYKLRLEQWRVQSERLMANTATLAKAQNKAYEGENYQGFQGSDQLIRQLGDGVRAETSARMKAYNDIVTTLGKCTEIMQGAILELGNFVKQPKDDGQIKVERQNM